MKASDTIGRKDETAKSVLDEGTPAIPRPIQEHLGQKLRAAYYEHGDRPAYLGDPAVPPELDPHIRKLEQRDRIHNKGVEAVEEALEGILHEKNPAR